MFILNKNTTNEIAVTLFEETTLSPVFYLFEFIGKHSKLKYYCISTDLSTEIPRSNLFNIIDTPIPNPLNSEVNLPHGQYDYNVYEQSNNTNLDPTGLTVVEGKTCRIIAAPITNDVYTGASFTNEIYNE